MELEREGNVFVLQLGEGENRVDEAFVYRFHAALDEIEASAGPAALVTTARGRHFSTGLDLEALASARARASVVLAELHRLFARLLVFPLTTVAALVGHAFAAGAMLALAHDFRVMREDRGWWCLPEIDLATGQPLTPGMTALIGARLERPVFHEVLVSGRRLGGPEALARHIVDELTAADAVLPRAVARARELAGKDRETLAAKKRLLYAGALEALRADAQAP